MTSEWVEPAPQGVGVAAFIRIPAGAAKNRRERVVGLTRPALEIIQRRINENPKTETVFSQENHKRAFWGAAKRIGYDKHITLRDLRHTFGTLAVQGTGDAAAGQAALGVCCT